MKARIITCTQGMEGTEYYGKSLDELVVGQARLSSSRDINELFDEPHKLLRHCITNGHWSIFDLVNLTFEVETSRAMGRELLRHSSIKPQERSQRYVPTYQFEEIEIREQSSSNRQSSTVVFDPLLERSSMSHDYPSMRELASDCIADHLQETKDLYSLLIGAGVAKECARMILPETATTTLILNGTIRSWITLLNVRLHHTAQKEIRLIAELIRDVLLVQAPIICAALFNFEDAYHVHVLDRVVLEKYGVYQMVKANNYKKLALPLT